MNERLVHQFKYAFLDEREDRDETGCCPVAEGVNQMLSEVLQPSSDSFDPVYVTATFLDSRYQLLLTPQQIAAAKTHDS